jgi:hypothetical protein
MSIIYRKHFVDPNPRYTPEAVEIFDREKRPHRYAEPMFDELAARLGELPRVEVSTSKDRDGRRTISGSAEGQNIFWVQLEVPVPCESGWYQPRELYLSVDPKNLLVAEGVQRLEQILEIVERTLVCGGSSRRGDLELGREEPFSVNFGRS